MPIKKNPQYDKNGNYLLTLEDVGKKIKGAYAKNEFIGAVRRDQWGNYNVLPDDPRNPSWVLQLGDQRCESVTFEFTQILEEYSPFI